MQRLNRDVYIAIFLLVFCGVFFWASLDIREPDYGTLPPSAWPRVILVALSLLSLLYLVQSLRRGPDRDGTETSSESISFRGFFTQYRNVFWCFILFFAYLAALPVLGMLIAGILFVFLLLTALGGWDGKKLLLHAAVAAISIGAMWSLFTFGLGVLLPSGMILKPF